jgi:DNA-binding transcriptional ArsR family regulator
MQTRKNTAATLPADRISALFQGLADINRLRIVNLLLQREELCVCDIEHVLAIPQARVSRHLSILRNAGLVSARRDGRWMHYQLIRDSVLTTDLFALLADAFASSDLLVSDARTLERTSYLACTANSESSCHPPQRAR